MDLPYENLTLIKGKDATEYDPKHETTPEFMNGKFSELLENDKAIKNQINVLNSHIAKLGVTQVRASNGGDANDLKETDKIFIFNYVNIPSGTDYGLLEIYNLESGGFAPSPDAVVVQRFTSWLTGYIYTRVYRKQGDTYVWSDWNSPDEKIATLQEQLNATQEMLVSMMKMEG